MHEIHCQGPRPSDRIPRLDHSAHRHGAHTHRSADADFEGTGTRRTHRRKRAQGYNAKKSRLLSHTARAAPRRDSNTNIQIPHGPLTISSLLHKAGHTSCHSAPRAIHGRTNDSPYATTPADASLSKRNGTRRHHVPHLHAHRTDNRMHRCRLKRVARPQIYIESITLRIQRSVIVAVKESVDCGAHYLRGRVQRQESRPAAHVIVAPITEGYTVAASRCPNQGF